MDSSPDDTATPLHQQMATRTPGADMRKIFLSYRHADTQALTARLRERLVRRFGKRRVFMDVESTPPAEDFPVYIDKTIKKCGVELVVIGERWFEGTDSNEKPLTDPANYIHREIRAALDNHVPVLPLLADDAKMPPRDALGDLADLTTRAGMELHSDRYFEQDVRRIMKAIKPMLLEWTDFLWCGIALFVLLSVVGSGIIKGPEILRRFASGLGSAGPVASPAVVNGKHCMHIGFLLPETTAARWEAVDKPDVIAAVKKFLPGATVDTSNAQGDQDMQLTQAQTELTKGACILVVAAVTPSAAAPIVAAAKAKNVPVIAYDRLISSDDLTYYASYDGSSIGVAQGTYIHDHYQQYVIANGNNNLIMINGSDADNNAHLFGMGAHLVLDPLIDTGALHKAYEHYTPDWGPGTAEAEMEAALASVNNKVAVAYVMNDDMANAVIIALQHAGLAGKVLVTGNDATVSGIHSILLGYQSMTTYKPIKRLADSVGQLVAAISNGTDTSALADQSVKNPNGAASIPSILNAVTTVDINNIKTTVIADGYVQVADVCGGVPAGAGGVCP